LYDSRNTEIHLNVFEDFQTWNLQTYRWTRPTKYTSIFNALHKHVTIIPRS
jgi:hypothetical protein